MNATVSEYFKRLKEAGIKTKNADKDYPIEVTRSDVEGARPGDPKMCVLARKAERDLGVKQVTVMNKVAYILRWDDETRQIVNFRYSLDSKVRKAVEDFDMRNTPFPPDTYVLHPVIKSERPTEKGKRDKKRKHRPSGKGGGLKSPRVLGHLRRYIDSRLYGYTDHQVIQTAPTPAPSPVPTKAKKSSPKPKTQKKVTPAKSSAKAKKAA